MKFRAIKSGAGWIVQNMDTHVVVGIFSTRTKAENVAEILNRK